MLGSGYFWWLRCFLVVSYTIFFGIGYGSMNTFRGLKLYLILYTTDHRFTNIRRSEIKSSGGSNHYIFCWSLHCDVGKLVTVYICFKWMSNFTNKLIYIYTQPLAWIKVYILSIKLNINLLYWDFQHNQCLNIKKHMLFTIHVDSHGASMLVGPSGGCPVWPCVIRRHCKWRPVLVVEEAGVPGENHLPWASKW